MIRAIAFHHGDDPALRIRLASYQRTALEQIATCGTAAAGMHPEICDTCQSIRYMPNSCGNRSCPHCQGPSRRAWVAAREKELLPCSYFHAVLTLPPVLRTVASFFPTVVLGALMDAAGTAIDQCCRSHKHLGAIVGQMVVLHTWRRDLQWHPHVHILVTAGGWDPDAEQWVDARISGRTKRPFLVPRDVLAKAFLRRLSNGLHHAYDAGRFDGDSRTVFPFLASRGDFALFLKAMVNGTAVVRIEPPFAGPQVLLKYLGAYVNRVACSPQRVLAHDPIAGTVTYCWKTNADPDTTRKETIPAVDFLVLFAQHILPRGFHRIRFRGLWSIASRGLLRRIQALRAAHASPPAMSGGAAPTPVPRPGDLCERCRCGYYHPTAGPRITPSPARKREILAALRHASRSPWPQEGSATA